MLAVALSLFGEGFNGPDGSGPAQHKSIGLTSGGKTHQLWRNGTDKGRDPLRAPHPITLGAAALFAHSTDGGESGGSTVSPSMPVGFNQRSVFDVVTHTGEDTTD